MDRDEREQVQHGHQQLRSQEGGGKVLGDEARERAVVVAEHEIEGGLHAVEQRQQGCTRMSDEERRLSPCELVGRGEVEATRVRLAPRLLSEDGVGPGAARGPLTEVGGEGQGSDRE